MKKNMAIAMFLVGFLMAMTFSACGKSEGPTTPTLPNKFEITGIENYAYSFGSYGVMISYTNNTDSYGGVSGKMYFGDGTSMDVESGNALFPKTTQSGVEFRRFNHDYASSGTYRVKAELTARFSNESISKSFEKDFTITIR